MPKGTYSFNLSGGDAAQDSTYHLVGSGVVTSNGNGVLSNMVLNYNYGEAEASLTLNGFYSIDSNGIGFATLKIAGYCPAAGNEFPGGYCGLDLNFSVGPNTMLFSADGSDPSICFCPDADAGSGEPFYGTAILQ